MSNQARPVAESVKSALLLLSNTAGYLSRAGLLDRYAKEIRDWRTELTRSRIPPAKVEKIREGIVAFRKQLRAQGFDLRLGSKDIALEGWRHENAAAEGFRRLVLAIGDDDVIALAGNATHNELSALLRQRLQAQHRARVFDMHFLWYMWRNHLLVLSGAASETSEQFEKLKRCFPAYRECLLRKLLYI